jgi:predicted  nucleic acid-binding Zn-ribbon protein
MAKQEKELTVEERLKALYNLQKLLTEVDRVKTLRGDLPLEVQDLEDEIAGLQTRVSNFNDEIAALNEEIKNQQTQRDNAIALIDKYTKDQDNVRNNREFDYLTKEIEYQHLNIELAEKKMNEAARKIEAIKMEIGNAKETLEDREHVLGEKKAELNEIVNETKQDEEKLREQARKLENKIDARLLTAFKRIRKNARNGLGVVYVQRNACGGCFNRIPPQRQMEIKMHKKIIVCEYCGRILVDPALAGVSEAEAKNA